MAEEIINEAALDKLQRAVGGDPEDLHELIDDFGTIGPDLIRQLDLALQNQDWKSLRVSAHSLKSNAREFGAKALEDLCQTLEKQCSEADMDQPERQIAGIAAAFSQAQKALEEYKNGRA